MSNKGHANDFGPEWEDATSDDERGARTSVQSAVVNAVIAAVGHVTTSLQKATDTDNHYLNGIFVNKTNYSWDVHWYAATHGEVIATGPSHHIMGYNEFEAGVKAALGDESPSMADLDNKISEWRLNQLLDTKAKDWVAYWNYASHRGGAESVVKFECKDLNQATIVCLNRKRPGGSFGAGASLSSRSWLAPQDYKGSDIMDHIKDVHTLKCQYSDGEGTKSSVMDGLKMTFTPGKTAIFELTHNGFNY